MRCPVILLLVVAAFVPTCVFSQEYSYTHYDITEGLAGTMAYCITQDADGFIWVGTETGVSRFDGTHFKNFTTADGLTDIEVLQIFGDSKGRVWMAPFRKSVCYFYRGKIYNPSNDPMLRKISLKGNVEGFAENARGDILIQEPAALHVILAGGNILNLDSINGLPIRKCHAVCRSRSGNFLVQEAGRIWEYSGSSFTPFSDFDFSEDNPVNIAMRADGAIGWSNVWEKFVAFGSGKLDSWPVDTVHLRHISYSLPDDRFVYFNNTDGSVQYDPATRQKRVFLPGSRVSKAFRDKDGNLWFTTLDRGLYRLNSGEFRSMTFFAGGQLQTGVTAISRYQDLLYAGNDYNQVFQLSAVDYKVKSHPKWLVESKEKLVFIDTLERSRMMIFTSVGVCRTSLDLQTYDYRQVKVKSVCKTGSGEVVIGSAAGVVRYSVSQFKVLDTLWRERATAVYYSEGVIYFGTMSGLYQVGLERPVVFMGSKIPFLQKRICSIASSADHTLWVASYDDAGVIGIRNDTVVARITKKQGLTSDICRTLLVRGNTLWVGTDKGLNAVALDRPGYPVSRYTSDDGLGSNMINTLCADDSMMYVGTSAGLSFFNVTRPLTGEPCQLRLLGVSNSGRDRLADTGNLLISYRSKDVRLDFAGISYRSAGKIRYRYRMLGLDSNWRETNQTFLDYPSLPSGGYIFQLQAINKFGNTSEVRSVPFVVSTPFWNQLWFNSLELAGFAGITWLFINWRIRRARRRQEERSRQSRRMVELEHIALQAQMNPHFIFNCLNSIQQFVFDMDMMATNLYISSFARLIRATLNHSSRPFISVAEEVEYLADYLSLEKMRFKSKMDYFVEVEPGLDAGEILMPPMLLQPYVENCVRHGLRRKTNGPGYVRIHFRKQGEKLVVTIRDNGIGRNKAREYKTAEHIEYQSKGMSLTSSRIQMINVLYKSQIEVSVEDIVDGAGQSDGTRIIMEFPVFPLSLR
jgi:hypothetical protein